MAKEVDITVTGLYSLPYTVQVQVSLNLAIRRASLKPLRPQDNLLSTESGSCNPGRLGER